MDDRTLLLRIRVVVVSTRAAVRSVAPGDGQLEALLERGRSLLLAMEPEVDAHGSRAVRDRLDEAHAELGAMTESPASPLAGGG